uniref:Uncharacterized protein n=1 Tax=Oryza barthii TaxID=65489 RepID=A0A0D3HM09_9ORYZ
MGQPYRELGECCLVDRQRQSEAGGVGRWKLTREKTDGVGLDEGPGDYKLRWRMRDRRRWDD